MTTELRATLLRRTVHLIGILPLLWVAAAVIDPLAVNPIQALILRSGTVASLLLITTLAITPLGLLPAGRRLAGWRKPLGLYTFGYAVLHMLLFSVLDFGGNLPLIIDEIASKPYIISGLSALLLLLPLALTSTRRAQQRLGRSWKRLHQLIYPAALLVIVHDVWQSKDARMAYAAGAIVVILLLLRLPALRSRLRRRVPTA